MRFNNIQTSLPGPILRSAEHNRTYTSGYFTASIELNSSVNPHTITVEYELHQNAIKKLLKKQAAALALVITCGDTYFYEHIPLSILEEQTVTLNEAAFLGRVYCTLIIKAVKPIKNFKPSGLIAGFDGMRFNIRAGDVLAVSDEICEDYQLAPVTIGSKIFELNELPALEPHAFNIALGENKIAIGAGVEINELIQLNMDTQEGKQKNLSAIYFPALIEVLYQIKDKPKAHGGKVWYESIAKAMTSQGHDITSAGWQPLEVAQDLLMSPYVELLGGKKK